MCLHFVEDLRPAVQFETFLEKPVGRRSRQQENDFKCCIMSYRFLWLDSLMVFELTKMDTGTTHGDNDCISNILNIVS